MKSKMMVSLLLGALPLAMMAQDDDMYFVPSKKKVERTTGSYDGPTATYYSGSNRSVDDYNRRGGSSYYQVIASDTTGNDIIDFSAERGVFPDSTQTEDFELTRQMTRWDGYTPTESYWQGYSDGREDALGWHSPWYASSFYPWYDAYWYWNAPWYYRHYGWYSPWYDPWYYDAYYWHRPYWYGGYHYVRFHGGGGGRGGLYARNGNTGTIDLRGGSRGRFSSSSTARRSTSASAARANTTVPRSTSGNFNRSSSSSTSGNFNRSSSVSNSTPSVGNNGSFSRSSSSGGGFSGGGSIGGGSRGGGVSRGGRR